MKILKSLISLTIVLIFVLTTAISCGKKGPLVQADASGINTTKTELIILSA